MAEQKAHEIVIANGVATIRIPHKGIALDVLVDASDLEIATRYRWCIADRTNGYRAVTCSVWSNRKQQTVVLARLLLGLSDRRSVADHINRDPLDNRRANLRETNALGNAQNTSARRGMGIGVRGVTRNERGGFKARVQVNRHLFNLGSFASIEEATEVVVAFRREHMPMSVEL